MKRFFVFTLVASMAIPIFADKIVEFNGTDFAGKGSEYPGSEVLVVKDGVTFKCDYGNGDRRYNDVNCYGASTITISAEENIRQIDFSFAKQNGVDRNGCLLSSYGVGAREWATVVGNISAYITKIVVTLGAGKGETEQLEVVTPEQAKKIGTTEKQYIVKGYITHAKEYDSKYKNQVFTMASNPNYDDPRNFRAWRAVVPEPVKVGDFVVVQGIISRDWDTIQIKNGICRFANPEPIPQYTITANVNDVVRGSVSGGATADILTNVTLTATANYGYHFACWTDWNTENPRTVLVTEDTTYTAVFEKNTYTITAQSANSIQGYVSAPVQAEYLDEVTLTATSEYNYHFTRWNDGNTDNPRIVTITRDTTFIAEFTADPVLVLKSFNTSMGSVSGGGQYKPNTECTISATAQYGYHFTKWNDGNTDNPRTVKVTQDITYTAYFAPNQYTISADVSDAERGSVSGGMTTDYLNNVTLTATADYGYHFAHWTDWNTDNPRTVQVTEDKTYTAVFEKNTYTITAQSANNIQGNVYAPYPAEYLDQVSLTAYPNVGYHFTQWADGNTDNPRTFVLTCDTTFTAEFAQTFSGQCGYDLYWKYAGHTLTISGTGAMYDYNGNDMPWLLFRDTTDAVALEPGITHIGNNAFNGFVKLGKIDLPNTLTSIGANAFAGCRKLYDIYAYPTEPPVADNTSFANYNVNLYVPCDNLRDYQMDAVFGTFKYIQCMSTTDNEQVRTDVATDHAAQKLFRDGQVYILRGSKTYTLTGVEVK